MCVWWHICEPGSRVKLPEADWRARLVRVWAPLDRAATGTGFKGTTISFYTVTSCCIPISRHDQVLSLLQYSTGGYTGNILPPVQTPGEFQMENWTIPTTSIYNTYKKNIIKRPFLSKCKIWTWHLGIQVHRTNGAVTSVDLKLVSDDFRNPNTDGSNIYLTEAQKILSQGSLSLPAGTIKIHKHTIRIRSHNNKYT